MRDHLRVWCDVREAVPWREVPGLEVEGIGQVAGVRDGAEHYIQTTERDRDPVRAERMLAALVRLRADAAAGRSLSFPVLCGWQNLVLGITHARFRSGPAFAKGGRERYGLDGDTQRLFGECLAESLDAALPLPARAARTYLDVCFFHPFDDGNARAALLAMTFVLASAGVRLDQVGPIQQLARRADDPASVIELARLLTVLIHASQRREMHTGTP